MLEKLRDWWEGQKTRYNLRHPRSFGEEDLSDDVFLVIQAASDLDIPEFELFLNAYQKWFGHTADEARVERYYLGYMFNGTVPPWVREYCRQVAASSLRHELDPVAFGVWPKLSRRVLTGLTMLAAAAVVLAAMVTVAEYTVDGPGSYQHLRQLDDVRISYRP